VKVWFEGGGQVSDSFTYAAKVESHAQVLVLAAEDYSGISPVYKKNNTPNYLPYYLDALAANGTAADVYDVDANGRQAPSALGVLSHLQGQSSGTPATTSSLASLGCSGHGFTPGQHDEMLAVRSFLKRRSGGLLYTGKYGRLRVCLRRYEFPAQRPNAPCNPNDKW